MPDGVVSSMDKCKFKSKNGGSRREEHNHPHQPLAVADQFLLKGEIDRAWIEYVSAFRAKSKKGIKNKDLQKLISLLWRRVYPLRPHVLPEAGGDQNTLDVTQSQRELLRCPKCRGILFEPSTLRCGHTFCMRCLKEKKNNKQRSSSSSGTNSAQDCQTCREAINYQRLEYPLKLNTVVNTVLTKWFESEIECVRLRLEGNDFFNKEQYDAALRRYTKAHNLCKFFIIDDGYVYVAVVS